MANGAVHVICPWTLVNSSSSVVPSTHRLFSPALPKTWTWTAPWKDTRSSPVSPISTSPDGATSRTNNSSPPLAPLTTRLSLCAEVASSPSRTSTTALPAQASVHVQLASGLVDQSASQVPSPLKSQRYSSGSPSGSLELEASNRRLPSSAPGETAPARAVGAWFTRFTAARKFRRVAVRVGRRGRNQPAEGD